MPDIHGPRRRIAIVIAVIAVIIGGVAAVAVASNGSDATSDRLERAGRTAAETGGQVDLGVLTGQRWDRVGVFSDYAEEKAVEKALRVSWAGEGRPFRGRDYTFHIVFARGDHVVADITVDGLVACLEGNESYARSMRFPARLVEDGVVQVVRPGGDC